MRLIYFRVSRKRHREYRATCSGYLGHPLIRFMFDSVKQKRLLWFFLWGFKDNVEMGDFIFNILIKNIHRLYIFGDSNIGLFYV